MHLPLSFAHWLAILSIHIRTTSELVIFPPNGVKGRAISLISPMASKFSNFFFFLLKITQKLLLFLNSSKRKGLEHEPRIINYSHHYSIFSSPFFLNIGLSLEASHAPRIMMAKAIQYCHAGISMNSSKEKITATNGFIA